ncbi:MAG: hypothetical protein LBU32_17430 [Clostridiales bacterium]|nr:hypothetical protein [Clostridiales bacterium]
MRRHSRATADGHGKGQAFTCMETDFVRAPNRGGLIEIQDPSVHITLSTRATSRRH